MKKIIIAIAYIIISNPATAEMNESYIFQRVSDSKILLSKNENLLLTPASLSKIPLTKFALKKYGSTSTFKTNFYYSGKKIKEKITGDLIVEASADPMLTNEKLTELSSRIRAMGIKEFSGNLVIEEGKYSGLEKSDPSRKEKKNSRNSYDASLSGFATNFNVIPLFTKRFEKSIISSTLPTKIEGVRVTSQIKSGRFNAVKATRYYSNNINNVTLKGSLVESGYKDAYVSSAKASLTSANTLRAILSDNGIIIKGKISIVKSYTPAKKLLFQLNGYPISKIIEGINKYSNNFMADMLMSKLADKNSRNIISSGAKNLTNLIRKETGNLKVEMYNGSGLSTHNKISTKDLNTLLISSSKDFLNFPSFLSSLPIPGTLGSLKRRFRRSNYKDLRNNIRAKTGTLTNPVIVTAIAGYINHPSEGLVAFSIIQNGINGKSQPNIIELRSKQEKIIYDIYKKTAL